MGDGRMRARFKKITDLFTVGREVELPDGSLLWVQALNQYERDDVMSEATLARSRIVMALKNHGDERVRVEGHFHESGREEIIRELALQRAEKAASKLGDRIRDDPEWRERMDILDRTDLTDTAAAPTDEERALIFQINSEFFGELQRRRQEEQELAKLELERLGAEELQEKYFDAWLDVRAGKIANDEYALAEMATAARYCDAVREGDGGWDHSGCGGHNDRVFENRQEAKAAPAGLLDVLRDALMQLAWSERDPKGSGRARGSSGSSSTRSEEEASTPSTSDETPSEAPGTSSQPSLTP